VSIRKERKNNVCFLLLDKPLLDLKGRYKWDAWNDLQGMISVEAEIQYIDFVEELKAKHK
jgi:diazepam-binding inhibitor (GABA receptor modulating acyl-CoA-binding protein)